MSREPAPLCLSDSARLLEELLTSWDGLPLNHLKRFLFFSRFQGFEARAIRAGVKRCCSARRFVSNTRARALSLDRLSTSVNFYSRDLPTRFHFLVHREFRRCLVSHNIRKTSALSLFSRVIVSITRIQRLVIVSSVGHIIEMTPFSLLILSDNAKRALIRISDDRIEREIMEE